MSQAPVPVPRSVLIVTGSETTRRMYAEYCAWRGIEAREVRGAAEAYQSLAAGLPDALVVEDRLPDGNGRDFVRALRRSRHTFDLPILLLASTTFGPAREEGRKPGGEVILTVPVLPDVLVEVLASLVRERVERGARPFESWLFVRGAESVWMVRTSALELAVAGPGDRRAAYAFSDEGQLVAFQAGHRQHLEQAGFAFEAIGTDRRSGRDRRREPRRSHDRRVLQ